MAENTDSKKLSGKPVKTKVKKMNGIQHQSTLLPIHDMLGDKLKAYYAQVASEPIPDRLTDLLAELEAQSAKKRQS